MIIGVSISVPALSRPSGGSSVPTGAIRQRDGTYILDRAGNYIEVRA